MRQGPRCSARAIYTLSPSPRGVRTRQGCTVRPPAFSPSPCASSCPLPCAFPVHRRSPLRAWTVALDGSAEDIDASCSRPLIRGAHLRLKDKVAIVTGGAHGMGEAEARLFAAEGAKVVVADILEHKAEIVASDIRAGGKEAMAAKIDVTSESEWVGLIAKAVATYWKLDILVNNAGISGSSVGDPDGLDGWHRI